MSDEAQIQLTLRLTPADDKPADPFVFDDIVRLIRQAVATAPKQVPIVTIPSEGFRKPDGADEQRIRSFETRIEHRIEQASAASQAAVEKRLEVGNDPDQSLEAAQQLISAVQRALLQSVVLRLPDNSGGRT